MRKHRKITKLRGTRTVGRGNSKHGRGKGSRMARGSVKIGGRNFMHICKYEPERFARKGFVSRQEKEIGINVGDLQKLAKDNEVDVTQLGYCKVLGGGQLAKPLKIKALGFSEKAKQKIAKAGGTATVIGEQ